MEAALFISLFPGDTERVLADAGLRVEDDFLLGDKFLFSGVLRFGALMGELSGVLLAFLLLVRVLAGEGLPEYSNISNCYDYNNKYNIVINIMDKYHCHTTIISANVMII